MLDMHNRSLQTLCLQLSLLWAEASDGASLLQVVDSTCQCVIPLGVGQSLSNIYRPPSLRSGCFMSNFDLALFDAEFETKLLPAV